MRCAHWVGHEDDAVCLFRNRVDELIYGGKVHSFCEANNGSVKIRVMSAFHVAERMNGDSFRVVDAWEPIAGNVRAESILFKLVRTVESACGQRCTSLAEKRAAIIVDWRKLVCSVGRIKHTPISIIAVRVFDKSVYDEHIPETLSYAGDATQYGGELNGGKHVGQIDAFTI